MAARTPKRVARKPAAPEPGPKPPALQIGERELRQLIRLLERRDVAEFEYEDERLRLRIGRAARVAGPTAPSHAGTAGLPAAGHGPSLGELRVQMPSTPSDTHEGDSFVTSPFVGTFYRSPSPDAPPFVEVGAIVKAGQPLCIIEAMKLMNEIEADTAGMIVDVLIENGKAVEFGQRLFRVRKVG